MTKLRGLMSCGSRDIFRNVPCLMYYTHHDVTDLENHGMVKIQKLEHLENGT